MVKEIILFTILVSTCFGQSNKKLTDTVFKKGDIIIAPTILYALSGGSYDFPPFKDSVEKISNFLKINPNLKIELGGHTDSRGKKEFNLKLSKQRMTYVKDYLVQRHGIDSLRIIVKGYGSSIPLISDSIINLKKTNEEKEELHQKNRRTELKILEVK